MIACKQKVRPENAFEECDSVFFSSDGNVIVECLLNELGIFFLCYLYCQDGAGKDKSKGSKNDSDVKASTKVDV
jgi:hypothetical protein